MMKPFLKWGARLIGVAILLYFAYFYYSLATGKERVGAMCTQMQPGMPVEELISLAEAHGLGASKLRPETRLAYLGERRSFGRHACRVELEGGIVKGATYSHAD